jgi:hypothetical protein
LRQEHFGRDHYRRKHYEPLLRRQR